MPTSKINAGNRKWLTLLCSIVLLGSFFLPWVNWAGHTVTGADMPGGGFFKTSETKFGLGNPFPQFSFTFLAFWLIPALAIFTGIAVYLEKKTIPLVYLPGAMSLALLVVYFLFTGVLVDLGVGNNAWSMLKPAAYLHAIAAAGLILLAFPVKSQLPKLGWLVLGPLLAFAGFKMGEKFIRDQTFDGTENITADYTVEAHTLIGEFLSNDTAANKKYLEKVIIVNGRASAAEILPDSTSTIKFADSTGSYAIFSLEKDQYGQAKKIQAGSEVSLKGVCSGSIFSEILGTTSISFKRATFNKQ